MWFFLARYDFLPFPSFYVQMWVLIFLTIDISYVAPQAHEIINVLLHREYSPGIVFIFSQGKKYLYHV
jgi:hypothetical protein